MFELIAATGVEPGEMERTFNLGLGMIAVVAADDADAAMDRLRDRGVPTWVCGTVRDRRDGEVGDAQAKGGAGGAVSLVGPNWF